MAGVNGLILGLILLLVVSYFNGSFVAWTVRDILYAAVMVPLGLTKQKTIDHFDNLFKGFDEMAIYWLTIFFVYALVKKQLGLTTPVIKLLAEKGQGAGSLAGIPRCALCRLYAGLGAVEQFCDDCRTDIPGPRDL